MQNLCFHFQCQSSNHQEEEKHERHILVNTRVPQFVLSNTTNCVGRNSVCFSTNRRHERSINVSFIISTDYAQPKDLSIPILKQHCHPDSTNLIPQPAFVLPATYSSPFSPLILRPFAAAAVSSYLHLPHRRSSCRENRRPVLRKMQTGSSCSGSAGCASREPQQRCRAPVCPWWPTAAFLNALMSSFTFLADATARGFQITSNEQGSNNGFYAAGSALSVGLSWMYRRVHLMASFRKAMLQQLSLVLSGSDVPAAPLSSGGEGRELHRAPPIREPRCSSAPRVSLWVNELYPEILSPPPPAPRSCVSVSNQFFKTHFSFAFSVFTAPLPICSFSSIHHCRFFLPYVPPLPILPAEASKNKLSLCLPTALLLCKTAGATWRSLKVHVPKSATGAPQLCCVGSGSLQLFFFFFGFSWSKLRIRGRSSYSHAQKPHPSLFHTLSDTQVVTRNLLSLLRKESEPSNY